MRVLLACLLTFLAASSPLAASDTKPPTVPRGLTVKTVTADSVTLSWQASGDFKGGSGVAGYDILRNGTQVGFAAGLVYQDGSLASATTYQYAVRARDNAGNMSVPSTPVSATTLAGAGCSAPPAAPALLDPVTVTSSSVGLKWTSSSPPAGCAVTYDVYRYVGGSPVAIATGLLTTTYTAGGLSPSTIYTFSVSARDAVGESPQSNTVSATTLKAGQDAPGFPTRVFAPYVDMLLWPTPSLSGMAAETDARFFSAGFIVAGSGCHATWGGHYAMSENFLKNDLTALRSAGGDVIASFGGAAGTELALACSTAAALQAEYQSVIDAYGFTRLDFDIEGSALTNVAANDRRAKAIFALQAAASGAGTRLVVQFTLPVLPSGLTLDGVNLLANAIANGVEIGVVNVMAMDYGRSYDANAMGRYAVEAMEATIGQLAALYGTSKTEAQVRAMVGVTPMIGLNDVSPEVFTLSDASTLLVAAQADGGIGLLSFWSATRDQPCLRRQVVSPTCSGVVQEPWAFTAILKSFTAR